MNNTKHKLHSFHLLSVLLFFLIGTIGVTLLYSTSISVNSIPNAHISHLQKLFLALSLLLTTALIDLKFFYRYAYVFYWLGIATLVYLLLFSDDSGVKRWINFGFLTIQPSEFMKIAVILVIARFFQTRCLSHIYTLPFNDTSMLVVLIFLPFALVMAQPNLGTASMILASSLVVCFLAGMKIRRFVYLSILFFLSLPFLWEYVLYDHQKSRILEFNTHYNIVNSKTSIGAGGGLGNGWQQGTQNQLGFLPEKDTDFIFAVLAEDFGFLGCSLLIFLYVLLITWGWIVTCHTKQHFSSLLASGLTILLSLYVLVNMGMVLGLLPIVGLPLPLVSHGGSSIFSFGLLFGLLLNIALTKPSHQVY